MTKSPAFIRPTKARALAAAKAAPAKAPAAATAAATPGAKPGETLQRIPLAQLHIAPENARFGAKDLGDITALALSIIEVGDLIDPLHAYPVANGEFAVWDGGRRWTALMSIIKTKKAALPGALAAGVPCLVSDSREAAMVLSAATFTREAMHPADEFLHYKRMLDAGMDAQRIAAACAVPTPRVNQLLRLVAVAPAILDAFKAGELALDVVEAFTLSLDQTKQLAVWNARLPGKPFHAYQVKSALRTGALGANDRIAQFVGREAYEAAGGTYLHDLFTDRGDESWADGDLATRLAQEKIDAETAKVQAEGWGWVKYADYSDYNYDRGYVRLPQPKSGEWKTDVMATAGAFLKMQYNGELKAERGWATAKAAAKHGGEALAAAEKAKPSAANPAMYGFSHKGHEIMTQVATEATKVGLLRKPEVAYDAMLSHLAWLALGGSGDATASSLLPDNRWGAPKVHVDGDELVEEAHAYWEQNLGGYAKDRAGFCDAVAALSAEQKASLLAYAFGQTLWAREEKTDWRKPGRWSHLGWIAATAGVEPAKAWTPDEVFLKGATREALLAAVKELAPSLKFATDPKKGDLVRIVAEKAKEQGWTPKLLATFADVPAPRPEAPDGDLSPALVALATGAATAIPDAEDGQD